MGTAGLGAELEHSLPILLGGLRPDGLGSEEGRVEAEVVTDDRVSDDEDTAGVGAAGDDADVFSGGVSCTSLILYHF